MSKTGNDQKENWALVTGAANGLGLAITNRLVKDGYHVCCVDFDEDGLKKLVEIFGDKIKPINADLSKSNEVHTLNEKIATGPQLELVFFNAGISATGKFENIPADVHKKVLFLNATSPMQMTVGLMQSNKIKPSGSLVFISSLSHAVGYPGAASYAASKDAIATYAKSITKPFKKRGINVSCVFPGPINTQHAERHAPVNANAEKRMSTDVLAKKIMTSVKLHKRQIYPGAIAKFTRIIAATIPTFMTKLMRRVIFEKLDKEVW